MNDQQGLDASTRRNTQKVLKKLAIRERSEAINDMVLMIMMCEGEAEFNREMKAGQRWELIHGRRYTNPNYDWYWHGLYDESYIKDNAMKDFQRAAWNTALKIAGCEHWEEYTFYNKT